MKYAVLAASIVIQVCLGGLYAWSGFVTNLRDSYGLSGTRSQLIFGVLIATFTITMIFSGRIQDRRGPRLVAAIGAVLFALGYCVASLSGGSFMLLLLGIGILVGAGTGFGYVSPLATCMKWFPLHKGLVTGIAVAGFGGGAVLLGWIGQWLLEGGMDVLVAFRWIGLTYGVCMLAAAMLMAVPPDSCRGVKRPMPKLSSLINDRIMWGLILGMLTGTFAGLLVVGNLSPMALTAGFAPATATLAITAFALGNAMGRIGWGLVSDKFQQGIIPISLAFLMVGVAALTQAGQWAGAFVAACWLVGLGFGACFVVYATYVADRYGADRVGGIYPIIFLAYGLSGILGPTVGGALHDFTHSFGLALWLSVLMAGFGAAGTASLLRRPGAHVEDILAVEPPLPNRAPAMETSPARD